MHKHVDHVPMGLAGAGENTRWRLCIINPSLYYQSFQRGREGVSGGRQTGNEKSERKMIIGGVIGYGRSDRQVKSGASFFLPEQPESDAKRYQTNVPPLGWEHWEQ